MTTLNRRLPGSTSRNRAPRPVAPRSTQRPSAHDPVALLRADHESIEELFAEFEHAPRQAAVRRSIVDRIIESVSQHVEVEEQTFYPWARVVLDHCEHSDADHLAALEEHRLMMQLIDDLRALEPDHERFDPRVRVMIELARHHMWEEESGVFVEAVETADDDAAHELARSIRRAHRRVA